MDITNDDRTISVAEGPPPMATHPINTRQVYLPKILGLLASFLAVGTCGYYLGLQSNYNSQTANTSANIPTLTSIRVPAPTLRLTVTPAWAPTHTSVEPSQIITIAKSGMLLHEHPTAHYTLEYPPSWKSELEPRQWWKDYQTFNVQSRDYELSGYHLEKGAAFGIFVDDTSETSIEDTFSKSTDAPRARNKIRTRVDGVEAIQYDIMYDWCYATMTTLIKSGKIYRLLYGYVDTASKSAEWNTYLNLLKSFKAR